MVALPHVFLILKRLHLRKLSKYMLILKIDKKYVVGNKTERMNSQKSPSILPEKNRQQIPIFDILYGQLLMCF